LGIGNSARIQGIPGHLRGAKPLMDTSEFGIWAMLLFWASALGGIGLAIGWARMKGRNPANRRLLEISLRRRLAAGDISREQFEKRMADLEAAGERGREHE